METGAIFVTAQDEAGDRLPGTVGTVTSPSLQGERVQVSNAEGEMRFLDLPPGEYNLTVSLEGFRTAQRPDIPVRIGQDTPVEVILQIANIEET